MAKQAFFKRFEFWLDLWRDDHIEIAEQIEALKSQRLFAQTIRDGIRLIVSLRQGDTSVLFELFPKLREAFQDTSGNPPSTTTAPTTENQAIQQHLTRLEKLILQQGVSPVPEDGGSLKPLEGASSVDVRPPDDLDVDLEIRQAGKDETNNPNYNFLISGAAMGVGSFDMLPPDVIAYGLSTGRIRPEQLE